MHSFWIMCLHIFFLYILDFKSCRSLYHISKYAHVFNEKNEIYYVHLHAYIYFHTLFIFINISTHTHTRAHVLLFIYISRTHTYIYMQGNTLTIESICQYSRCSRVVQGSEHKAKAVGAAVYNSGSLKPVQGEQNICQLKISDSNTTGFNVHIKQQ